MIKTVLAIIGIVAFIVVGVVFLLRAFFRGSNLGPF
jgi:hypothetical protein